MKRIIQIIGLLLLLSFAACDSPQSEARRMVARAEALSDTLPDSTVLLIDSVSRMEVYFSERSRMEMALLHADALFRGVSIDDDDIKAVLDRRSPIPDLERAASYFAEKRDYAKAALAALYSGYVQQYYKEKAKAMQSYKDAEQYGTLANDHYIVAKTQYRMGEMLLDDGRWDESIGMLKKASLGFKNDQLIEKALSYNMMGVSNMLLTQYDSAEICLQKSMEYGVNIGSSSLKYKVLNNYSVLYLKKKQIGLAFDCLNKISQDLDIDSTGLYMYYLNMGQLYLSIGSIDSSFYYLRKMKNIMPIADVRKETLLSAYGALSRAAKSIGNDSLAIQYREIHEDLLYDVMSQRQDQSVLRIKQQYDFDQLQNAIDKKTAQIKQMVAIGIVLLLGILLFFLYRLAQKNKREAEINADLFHFMQQNEELKLRHEAYRKEDDAKSQQLAKLLSEKLQMMQKLDYFLNNNKDKSTLNELEKELFDGKQHLKKYMEVFDMMYPGLQDTLKAKYPQMSELDYMVCLLSRLKLSRTEEADLLRISTSVLDKIRGKVHRMMAEEKV